MSVGYQVSFCIYRTKSGDNTTMYRIEKINDTQVKVIRVYKASI